MVSNAIHRRYERERGTRDSAMTPQNISNIPTKSLTASKWSNMTSKITMMIPQKIKLSGVLIRLGSGSSCVVAVMTICVKIYQPRWPFYHNGFPTQFVFPSLRCASFRLLLGKISNLSTDCISSVPQSIRGTVLPVLVVYLSPNAFR